MFEIIIAVLGVFLIFFFIFESFMVRVLLSVTRLVEVEVVLSKRGMSPLGIGGFVGSRGLIRRRLSNRGPILWIHFVHFPSWLFVFLHDLHDPLVSPVPLATRTALLALVLDERVLFVHL